MILRSVPCVSALVLAAALASPAFAQTVVQTPPPPAGQTGPGGAAPMQGGPGGPQGGPGGGMGGGMMPRATADVPAWSDRLFTRLDANHDDAITGSELTVLTSGGMGARGGSRLRAMISQSDASGDSRISREELAAGAQRMFTRMDRNGDGRLEGDELPQPPAAARPPAMPMPAPAQPTMPTFPMDPSGG